MVESLDGSLGTESEDGPRILDMGCGTGGSSLVLARETGGTVTAVDLHRVVLEEWERRAEERGLSGRIRTVCEDMAEFDGDEPFDLVWSEGAIYNVRFEAGLTAWREFVKPGGCIAVTELTRLSDEPPEDVRSFWGAEYPAMATVEENRSAVQRAGLEPVGDFELPESDWLENFYEPMAEFIASRRERWVGQPDRLAFLDAMGREIEMFRKTGGAYGYVFYVMRRPADDK